MLMERYNGLIQESKPMPRLFAITDVDLSWLQKTS